MRKANKERDELVRLFLHCPTSGGRAVGSLAHAHHLVVCPPFLKDDS